VRLSVVATSALGAAERAAIVAVCERATGDDFSILFELVERSPESWHVLAQADDELVGHALWYPRWLQPEGFRLLRSAYVEAVAVDPAWQGQGVGSALLQRLAEETANYELGALSTERHSFYGRLGWEIWEGPLAVRTPDGLEATTFDDADDRVMILRTALTPPLDLTTTLIAEPRSPKHW
jgi:aminoglycoside 2'-N-acetyltransferase I